MEDVAVDWIGSAIGGAVGVGAWVAGQATNAVNVVIDGVRDVVDSLTPDPYEEWLNAPTTESAAPKLEFRNPANETNKGATAAELISAAGVQETKTGTSSPNNSPLPDPVVFVPEQQDNQNPQNPLTPDFVPPPQTVPPTGVAANVLIDLYEGQIINEPVEGISYLRYWPVFRGQKGDASQEPYDRFTFAAEKRVNDLGEPYWIGVGTLTLLGNTVKTWTFDAGQKIPSAGEVAGVLYIPEANWKSDWFDSSGLLEGGWIRRYSIKEPVAPPIIPNPAPLPIQESSFPVLTNTDWATTTTNTPGFDNPAWGIQSFPTFLPAASPGTKVPTPPNNPTEFPPIGTDGNIVLPPSQVPTVRPDVHYVYGRPFNSGGVRKDIAGVAKEVGRIEAKAADLLNRMGPGPGAGFDWTALWLALQALAEFFEQPLDEASYTLTEPCTPDGEDPRKTTVVLPQEKWADRVISLGDMMPELLQAHKDYKQPTCPTENDPIILEGDYRTISFRSDETSPYGKSRLRKRFRYRSLSRNDLGAVVDHWEDFSFEAGPYRVRWVGKSWRTPEVWAASEAEGKRVIQHAAREAGVDPLEDGRWSTRVSSSARLGVSGTMRIDTTGGYYWITARDGSSERPIVAKT